MNTMAQIGVGTDAKVLAGYATRANERLGSFGVLIENTGDNTLYLRFKEWDGTTSPSGWADVANPVTVVARGKTQANFNLVSQKLGFFGSGKTSFNASVIFTNKGDLRGAQIDLVVTGRRNWGFDDGFDTKSFVAGFGAFPDTGGADKATGE